MKTIGNIIVHTVAQCSLAKTCRKCSSIEDPVVVHRNGNYSLYCTGCGKFIKLASLDDKRHIYKSNVISDVDTPSTLRKLYVESEESMFVK